MTGIQQLGACKLARINADKTLNTVALWSVHNDDHNAPAIAYRSDKDAITIFGSDHGNDALMRLLDVDRTTLATSNSRNLTFSSIISYAQLLTTGDRIVIIGRLGSVKWVYMMSDDWGATWSAQRTLIDSSSPNLGQVYIIAKPLASDATKAQFAFVGHPSLSTYRPIMHGLIDLVTGAITTDAGGALGDLDDASGPSIVATALTTAVPSTTGVVYRLLDVGEVGGRYAVLYAEWESANDVTRYRIATYSGGSWTTAAWAPTAGAPFGYTPPSHYQGGAVFSRDNGAITSREAGGGWYVDRWTWNGSDLVFAHEMSSSTVARARPLVPTQTGLIPALVGELTTYTSYTQYYGLGKVIE